MAVFDADRRLRVVALFSGGASGVRYLAEHDPGYGDAYEVVGGFTDDPGCPGADYLRDVGVPVAENDIRAFYEARGAPLSDLEVRAEFDRETRELIGEFEPDLLVLSGYMWILTEAVIGTHPTVNVHPADLTVETEGERVYVGADPVYDAVTAGEPETRSSVHFVTADVDAGPVLVLSEPFSVHRDLVDALADHGADAALRDYVDAHQEWMKWEGDGPCLATALSLIAAGRVERDGAEASIDGERGLYDLGEGRVRAP